MSPGRSARDRHHQVQHRGQPAVAGAARVGGPAHVGPDGGLLGAARDDPSAANSHRSRAAAAGRVLHDDDVHQDPRGRVGSPGAVRVEKRAEPARKAPGSTIVTRTPSGSTSRAQHLGEALDRGRRRRGGTLTWRSPDPAADRGDLQEVSGPLPPEHRQRGPGHGDDAEQVGLQLRAEAPPSVMSSMAAESAYPALLTTTSSRPKASTAVSTARCAADGSVTSAARAAHAVAVRSTRSCRASGRRAVATRRRRPRAPRRRARGRGRGTCR